MAQGQGLGAARLECMRLSAGGTRGWGRTTGGHEAGRRMRASSAARGGVRGRCASADKVRAEPMRCAVECFFFVSLFLSSFFCA